MPHQFNVVLVEPEIPPNTGTIGRTCLAVGAKLHLVHPLGFELSEARVRRAGLDYWKYLDLVEHQSLDHFFGSLPADAPLFFFSKKVERTIYDEVYPAGAYFIFGKETKGLPEAILQKYPNKTLRIPMYDDRVRSLNLATSVGIVVYEGIRQLGV